MAERDVPRGNLHDVRKNLGSQLSELDDWIERIVDYLGAVPPSGLVMEYQWQTATAPGDPGAGYIAANTNDVYTVQFLYISKWTRNGNDIGVIIEALDPLDLLLLFEEPNPFGTSYYTVQQKAVLDVSGNWYTLEVESSTATGQALPTLLGNDVQFGIIGNPNRYLPEGGNTGDIIHKVSDDNYDVEWVDGTTKFLPQGTQHNDLPGIGPDDHHPKNHALYGDTQSDVDITQTLAARDLLARPEANDKFYPETRQNWRGFWGQQTYYKHDVVFDPPWQMIANKETTDRAAPQPVGDPTFTLPDIPTWGYYEDDSVIYSGHLYSFTETGYFRALRVWVPELTDTTNYRIVLVRNPNSSNPEYTSIPETILQEDDWTTIGVSTQLVLAGEELLVILDSYNSAGETTWAYNWLYGGINNIDADPGGGNWEITQQNNQLKINWDDAEVPAVGHQLELQVVPNTVFEISEVGNPANFIHYQVQGAYIENAGWTTYNVTVVNTGGVWPPPLATGTQIRAVQPISNPTKFVGLDAYWGPGTLPNWAGIQSYLQFNGVPQAVQGDEAYGVDIAFQELITSPDWDIMGLPGGGGGEGSGNPFPEAPDTGFTYGRHGTDKEWLTVFTQAEANAKFPDDEFVADGQAYGRVGSTRAWEAVYRKTESDNLFVPEAPDTPDEQPYARDGTNKTWVRGISYDQLRAYIDWDVDNTDHTAEWGDRTLVEAGPSTITMPEALDADPVDDLLIWNNGSNFTEKTTLTPAPGHGFVFNGETSYDPFTLKAGEVVRLTSRASGLYNVAIEAAAPFNGPGTVGLVPNPPSPALGRYLSDSGAWQSIVAPPTGGAVELEYDFRSITTGVPQIGEAYVDDADPSQADFAVVNMTTRNGNRFQQLWQSFQEDDILWFVDQAGGNTYGYILTGPGVPNDPNWDNATYVTYPLGVNDTEGTIPDGTGILISFLSNPNARLPPGGNEGDALVKYSDANFDTVWSPVVLEAPNDGWSHSRQYVQPNPPDPGYMEWNSHPSFEGPVLIGVQDETDTTLLVEYSTITERPLGITVSRVDENSSPANLRIQKARGVKGAYLPILSGDTIGNINFCGRRDAGWGASVADIRVIAAENYTDAVGSAHMTFSTSPLGGNARVERMRITDAGNVGIGTTSPARPLDVNGTARVYADSSSALYIGTGANSLTRIEFQTRGYVGYNGGQVILGSPAANPKDVYIMPGDSALLIVKATGNVGIGTTSPVAFLDVAGSADSTTALLLRDGDVSTGTSDKRQIVFGFNGTDDYGHVIRTRHDASSVGGNAIDFYVWHDGVDDPADLGTLHTMSLAGGNVGIGTTSPAAPLHISGGTEVLRVEGSGNTYISLYQSGFRGHYQQITGTGYTNHAESGRSMWLIADDYMRFSAGGTTERMRITSSGNVGIGDTSPNQKLVVSDSSATGPTYISVQSASGAIDRIRLGYEGRTSPVVDSACQIWADSSAGNLSISSRPNFASYMRFFTSDGAPHERMRITSAGNVGIGTTNPVYKLDVAGDINITGTYRVNGTPTVLLQQTQLDAIMNRIDALETQVVALGGTI